MAQPLPTPPSPLCRGLEGFLSQIFLILFILGFCLLLSINCVCAKHLIALLFLLIARLKIISVKWLGYERRQKKSSEGHHILPAWEICRIGQRLSPDPQHAVTESPALRFIHQTSLEPLVLLHYLKNIVGDSNGSCPDDEGRGSCRWGL